MTGIKRLALFDVDGTIAEHGVFPPSIVEGIRHLQQNGYVTTISTGRGYIRAKEALGTHFDELVSPEALLIIEHGSKIVNKSGDVVFAEYFDENEINHIVDFTRANIDIFRLAWFNPVDVNGRKIQVWCYDENELDKELGKRGHYADVFHDSLGGLKERLLAEQLSNVTLKLKEYVKVQNLKLAFTRTQTNVIFQDGNMEFIKNNVNKAIAIQYLLREYGMQSDDLLVAGNAINDVEMLNVEAKHRILVGSGDESDAVLNYLVNNVAVTRVDTPEDLGNLIKTID